MKRFALCVVVVLVCGVGQADGSLILWDVASGGNGHYYEHVSPTEGITWTDAKAAAESLSYLGAQGHLATVTIQAEWDFVLDSFPVDLTWIGLTDFGHENDFQWITDEPLVFTAWGTGPNEPNGGTDENWVHYGLRSTGWGWNDFRDMRNAWTSTAPFSYLVEYDTNVIPEPSSLIVWSLIGLTFGGIGWRRRRKAA